MPASDLPLDLPWFQSMDHEINWGPGQVLGWWALVGYPGNEYTISSLCVGDRSVGNV